MVDIRVGLYTVVQKSWSIHSWEAASWIRDYSLLQDIGCRIIMAGEYYNSCRHVVLCEDGSPPQSLSVAETMSVRVTFTLSLKA
jgi:hypothetical protein